MRMHKLVVLRILCVALLLASSVAPAQAQEAAVGGPITAADINALRTQAERLDPNGCSSVFRWTDDPIVPGETPVRADHLIELRRALNEMVLGRVPDDSRADNGRRRSPFERNQWRKSLCGGFRPEHWNNAY